MKTRYCEVCGTEFQDSSKFKPKQYCSLNCSDYNKFKNALENTIIKINATKAATTIIRGDMFRFANILSKSTKTKEKS